MVEEIIVNDSTHLIADSWTVNRGINERSGTFSVTFVNLNNFYDTDFSLNDAIVINAGPSRPLTNLLNGVVEKTTADDRNRLTLIGTDNTGKLSDIIIDDESKMLFTETDVKTVVNDLIDTYASGLMTRNNVSSTATDTVDSVNFRHKTLMQAMRILADYGVGYNFFLDSDFDLHWEAKSTKEVNIHLVEGQNIVDILKTVAGDMSFSELTVYGDNRSLPSDRDDWTEGRAGDWATQGTDPLAIQDNSDHPVGDNDSLSVRMGRQGSANNGGALFQFDISSATDLTEFDNISFWLRGDQSTGTMTVRVVTSGGSFFQDFTVTSFWVFYSFAIDTDDWSETSTPDWTLGDSISFLLSGNPGGGMLEFFIDHLRFDGNRNYKGSDSESTSGVRDTKEKSIVVPHIKSDEEAATLAGIIRDKHKSLVTYSVNALDPLLELNVGDSPLVTMPTFSIDSERLKVSGIQYSSSGGLISTSLQLSNILVDDSMIISNFFARLEDQQKETIRG